MASTVVPTICVSPPPPQEPEPEPCSPFANIPFPKTDADFFTPHHLSPPSVRPTPVKHLSPLSPPDAPVTGKGMERERFEALLKASRERNALIGAKKEIDLRKEIALKAHRNKQAERRALFLSKVLTPPSPAAVSTPKTPPDSPAIFHYSLPSPGLASPLSLFDSPHDVNDPYYSSPYSCRPWVEQVDFRLCNESKKQELQSRGAQLPSLEQISARLRTLAQTRSSTVVDGLRPPATAPNSVPSRRPATIEVGRLKMPVRAVRGTSAAVNNSVQPQSLSFADSRQSNIIAFPLKCPPSPFDSDTQDTTFDLTLSGASPAPLTESNLKILETRERTAHNMLSTLRRRTLSMPQPPQPQTAPAGSAMMSFNVPGLMTRNAAKRTMPLPVIEESLELDIDARKSRWKRHSAPADLMPRERTGFEHPVLALPGAF